MKNDVKLLGGFGNKCNKDTQYHEQNRIYDGNKLATSIPAESGFHPYYAINEREYCDSLRIRKLTPLECLRLMGFTDDDYEAMVNAGMSNAAIYHCAGDSIVVNVLYYIFKELV